MDSQTKDKVERTRGTLNQSILPDETKVGLHDLVDMAERAANGHPDKIQAIADAILALALHEIRATIQLPGMMDKVVKSHADSCRAVTRYFFTSGKIGIFLQCIHSWPLAIVLVVLILSPSFPAVLELFRQIIK